MGEIRPRRFKCLSTSYFKSCESEPGTSARNIDDHLHFSSADPNLQEGKRLPQKLIKEHENENFGDTLFEEIDPWYIPKQVCTVISN